MKTSINHYPSLTEKDLAKVSGGDGGLAVAGIIFAAGSLALGVFNAGYKFGSDLARRGRK